MWCPPEDEALCIFSLDHLEITWCSSHCDSRSWELCHLWLCPDVLPAWGFNHPMCNCGTRKVEVYSPAKRAEETCSQSRPWGIYLFPWGHVWKTTRQCWCFCSGSTLDRVRIICAWRLPWKSDLETSAVTSQARASRADRVDIDVPALVEPLDIVFLRMKITSVCFGPGGGRMFLNTSPSKKPGFCYLHLNVRQGSSHRTGIENLRSVTSLARCVSFQKVGRVMGRLTFCVVKLLHSSSLLASFGMLGI